MVPRRLAGDNDDDDGGTGEGGETNSWGVWLVALIIVLAFIVVWAVIIWYCCFRKKATPVAPRPPEPAPPPPEPPKPKPIVKEPKRGSIHLAPPPPPKAPEPPPPEPLKAWAKVKGVPPMLKKVETPTPLTLRMFHVKAFEVIDADDAKGSGKSDPFLRFVHPPSGKSSRTETRRNESDPEFENRVQLTMPAGFDHPPRIKVELWDKDWTKPNTLLADQIVCLDGVIDEGEEVDDGVNAQVKLTGAGGFPDVKIKFAYDYTFNVPDAAVLELFELKAFNVPDADSRKGSGESDPYIRFHLMEVDEEIAAQTKELMNEINPVWNETLSINLPLGSPRPPLLQVCLWDKDFGDPDDSLASHDVRLPLLDDEDDPSDDWRACPETGDIEMTLVGHKPFRDVRVTFKYRMKKA